MCIYSNHKLKPILFVRFELFYQFINITVKAKKKKFSDQNLYSNTRNAIKIISNMKFQKKFFFFF